MEAIVITKTSLGSFKEQLIMVNSIRNSIINWFNPCKGYKLGHLTFPIIKYFNFNTKNILLIVNLSLTNQLLYSKQESYSYQAYIS